MQPQRKQLLSFKGVAAWTALLGGAAWLWLGSQQQRGTAPGVGDAGADYGTGSWQAPGAAADKRQRHNPHQR